MTKLQKYLHDLNEAQTVNLFEHEIYKHIPGTKNSYRMDPGDTNTFTLQHSHVYAKLKGGGRELYSVNLDGTGHDGSSGRAIPSVHADYLRSRGFKINNNNILESLDIQNIDNGKYELLLLENV